MDLFRKYRWRHKIQQLLKEMPPYLAANYGVRDFYKQKHIDWFFAAKKIPPDFLEYAYAIFMTEKSFRQINAVDHQSYTQLRTEVKQHFFPQRNTLETRDIMDCGKTKFIKKPTEISQKERLKRLENAMNKHWN